MRTLITGLGEVVSGDIAAPLLDADSILIEDGRITAVGRGIDEDADVVIDGKGATAFPGLIDSHVHPVFGDWTPRQRTTDFIESELHGGVTSMISAGEVHLPGRPKDIVGLKALAIVAVRGLRQRPAGGRQGPCGRPDPRARSRGAGLRRPGGGRRQPHRRGRPGLA